MAEKITPLAILQTLLGISFVLVSTNYSVAQQPVKPNSVEWKAASESLNKAGFRIYEHDDYFVGKIPIVQIDKPFVRVKHLPEVPFPHCVYLQYSKFSDDEIIALKNRKTMKMCDVGWTDVTDKAIQGLVESETLEHLVLTNTKVTDASCESIRKSKSLKGLRIFYVHGITGKGFSQLLEKKDWESLHFGHELVLTDEQLKSFSGLAKLRKLSTDSMKGVPKMMESLKDSKDLEFIKVTNSDINSKSIQACANHPKLKFIDFHISRANNDDLEAIGKATDLEELILSYPEFDDSALKHLHNCKKLTRLDLPLSRLTDNAIPELITMKNLKNLNLFGSKVSDDGVKKLKAALPGCEIKR